MSGPFHLAVLTSGGDAPGMNAAIRAAVRCSAERGWLTSGIRCGFRGLCDGAIVPLRRRDVGGILHLGGTMLGTSRHPEFAGAAERRRALATLEREGMDALVVIGGNGSQQGAHALAEMGFQVVGIASTIDNDLAGTDITLGVDTALDVALESIDRLRTTAQAHGRVFLVEVMGRDSGYLALMLGLAGGAEAVVIPEEPLDLDQLARDVRAHHQTKGHAIVVVAEGAPLGAAEIAAVLEDRADFGVPVRVTVLGHVQRGGVPSAFDRILGCRLGAAAIDAIAAGESDVLMGMVGGAVVASPLPGALDRAKRPHPQLHDLNTILAR